MIPTGLKIGDTFEERDFRKVFKFEITGFDGQGNYISKLVGEVSSDPIVPVKDVVEEELPFAIPDNELAEAQPVVEEEKKTAPKKRAAGRKTSKK